VTFQTDFLKYFTIVLTLFVLQSCDNNESENTPDVSNIEVNVKIDRFEQDLFGIDTMRLEEEMARMGEKYPELFPLFTGTIIHDQTNPKETPEMALSGFLRSSRIRQLNDTVQQVYKNIDPLEKDINQLFRYYRYYFPDKPIPKVATVISEFGVDAFTYGDQLCGIGLDMFLGENYPGYNPEIFPAYLRRQFNNQYITIRLAKTLAQNTFGDTPPGKSLLDIMLYNGKMLYIVDKLLPGTPDSLVMGYTKAQMEGCISNEQAVWARILDQKLLYSTDFGEFRKMVTPSPNAPVIFQEAPGEIGNWIGWQIVKAYVKRNPKAGMKELISQTDAQKFLESARYKPQQLK